MVQSTRHDECVTARHSTAIVDFMSGTDSGRRNKRIMNETESRIGLRASTPTNKPVSVRCNAATKQHHFTLIPPVRCLRSLFSRDNVFVQCASGLVAFSSSLPSFYGMKKRDSNHSHPEPTIASSPSSSSFVSVAAHSHRHAHPCE